MNRHNIYTGSHNESNSSYKNSLISITINAFESHPFLCMISEKFKNSGNPRLMPLRHITLLIMLQIERNFSGRVSLLYLKKILQDKYKHLYHTCKRDIHRNSWNNWAC